MRRRSGEPHRRNRRPDESQHAAPALTNPYPGPPVDYGWTILYTHDYTSHQPSQNCPIQAVAGRLLRNQEDIGTAIVPYYGKDAGTKLTDLLKQHIMIAVDVVAAAKSGDQMKFGEADKKWIANTDDIALRFKCS